MKAKTVCDVIFNHECVPMLELQDSSIDLVVSGPPYWTRFDYSAFTAGQPYLWQSPQSYASYLDDLHRWHAECYRVLRAGCFCILVLGSVERDGKTYQIPFDALPILRGIGFDFCYEIIWNKVTGGRQSARNFLRWPRARRFRPNVRNEYILVFRKPGKDPEASETLHWGDGIMSDRDFFTREIANNIWNIPAGQGRQKYGSHPCPFPLEIPARLIELFSVPGETVLDPFMGTGTTAVAARRLGRHFVGFEREAEFCKHAEERLAAEAGIPKGWRSRIIASFVRW